MSKHPATPMNEADLRDHLARQTSRRSAAMNVLHLEQPIEARRTYYHQLRAAGADIIVFDTINDDHLRAIGDLLDTTSADHTGDHPLLVVGSSGVEKALTLHWHSAGRLGETRTPSTARPVKQLIVVSGSAAPATAAQIQWAGANGFVLLRLNSARLVDPAVADQERETAISEALHHLSAGMSVVLYSACAPDDPHIAETKAHLAGLELDPQTVGARLGTQQGLILRALLEKTGLHRAVVTGGDTCGYAARQLGIYALSAVMPVAPGAPLCRGYSADPAFDGLQISREAGQVGKVDYFGSILHGSI